MVNGQRGNNMSNNWMTVPTGLGWAGVPDTYGAALGPAVGGTMGAWGAPMGYVGTTTSDITRTPLADIVETDNDVLLSVELPGVRREDIDLDVREYSIDVTVSAVDTAAPDETVRYSRNERGSENGFYRTIALPLKVKPGEAQARFENGLLKVSIPKADENRHASEHVEIQ